MFQQALLMSSPRRRRLSACATKKGLSWIGCEARENPIVTLALLTLAAVGVVVTRKQMQRSAAKASEQSVSQRLAQYLQSRSMDVVADDASDDEVLVVDNSYQDYASHF